MTLAAAVRAEAGAQRVDGFPRTTGEHLDATVGEVARVARDAELLGTLTGARAKDAPVRVPRRNSDVRSRGRGFAGGFRHATGLDGLGTRQFGFVARGAIRPAAGAIPRPQRLSRLRHQRGRERHGARFFAAARTAWRALLISCTGAPAHPAHAIAQSTSSSQAKTNASDAGGSTKGIRATGLERP